ncbi:MAG: hypothetical protein QN173_02245 [Armatimonadota bacterium]|nr:hypothetical protein [Armatimonadota bacterium]MDR7401757.1 hypothetical protein [Armatimonadota bacterium]MDR7403059.1 hypothetical protein [Armatimonadota bacterium]MDR7436240.1 hypothetical protein [Armatimonadota bacterium]MDR7471380.1 hypothetical protein [Armatimonadota bacterium]
MAELSCCGLTFASAEDLARHEVTVHGAHKPVAGTCCGLEFYTRSGLDEHRRTAHGAKTS